MKTTAAKKLHPSPPAEASPTPYRISKQSTKKKKRTSYIPIHSHIQAVLRFFINPADDPRWKLPLPMLAEILYLGRNKLNQKYPAKQKICKKIIFRFDVFERRKFFARLSRVPRGKKFIFNFDFLLHRVAEASQALRVIFTSPDEISATNVIC